MKTEKCEIGSKVLQTEQ